MKRKFLIATILATVFLATNPLAFAKPEVFECVSISLEQNFTDKDTEIVLFAKGNDEGLKTLNVFDPKGKAIFQLKAEKRVLGTREFSMESPEPGLQEVLQAYPKGEYTFKGQTVSGLQLESIAILSHKIPTPSAILSPRDSALNVNPDEDLKIKWSPVKGSVRYLFQIEREKPEPKLMFQGETMPPSTSFTLSKGWLEAGSKYQVAIAVVNADGNNTWVEQAFSTAQ